MPTARSWTSPAISTAPVAEAVAALGGPDRARARRRTGGPGADRRAHRRLLGRGARREPARPCAARRRRCSPTSTGAPARRSSAISSIEGIAANPWIPSYCASKAGLLGLTRSMAAQLGAEGIRVNSVCPGFVVTPMLQPALDIPELKAEFEQATPLGRMAQPREIADGRRVPAVRRRVVRHRHRARRRRRPDLQALTLTVVEVRAKRAAHGGRGAERAAHGGWCERSEPRNHLVHRRSTCGCSEAATSAPWRDAVHLHRSLRGRHLLRRQYLGPRGTRLAAQQPGPRCGVHPPPAAGDLGLELLVRLDRSEAFAFEKRVQGWSRKKREALIRGEFEALPDLSRRTAVQRRMREEGGFEAQA